jgi:hypothetical protein
VSVHIHFERPAGILVQNLAQEFCGWIAIPDHARNQQLEFAIDGRPVAADCYRREDVEQKWPGRHIVGWTFWLDPADTFRQGQRTLEFRVRLGGQWTHKRRFYKSRSLLPESKDGALYFMHIPKTAGTALRAYVNFAFSEFPSLLVYGHFPGLTVDDVAGTYRGVAKTRELFYGHFDFALARQLQDCDPKCVTVFRQPDELIRSYLSFNPDPNPVFLDNPLTRHVCGLSYASPYGLITAKHLDQALQLIERHFYVVQQPRLQQFADELSVMFGLERFLIPRINVSRGSEATEPPKLAFDITYDIQLYEACQHRWRSFLAFLDE